MLFYAAFRRDSISLLRFPLAMSKSSRIEFRQLVAWNMHTVVFIPISISHFLLFILTLSLDLLAAVINLFPCEVFTPSDAGNRSQQSEWQQVFSGLPESSQDSGRSQKGYGQDGLDSSDYQFLQFSL